MSPVLLIILDGFGEAPPGPGNAITRANMTFYKQLRKNYPWTLLKCSGNAVGLPAGYQGNSEVGHFTIGSGRITWQSFEEINRSIRDKSFFKKKALVKACASIREANKKGQKRALHLLGMISDEGVHSHIDHLFALLKLAKLEKTFPVYIHAILDGRDVPERSADKYLKMIQNKIKALGLDKPLYKGGPKKASIATIVGRYFAMDRDTNWSRTKKAYDLYVHGKGIIEKNPLTAIKNAYENGAETDYYVPPIILDPHGIFRKNDSVIFFNYRTDRSKQITDALLNKKFDHFKTDPLNLNFVAMGPFTHLAPVVFPTPEIRHNLADVLSSHRLRQLRVAETEKYAHVTFFFNSQIETPYPLETRVLIPSPKCPSYAEKPEMSAPSVTHHLIDEIKKEKYPFIATNFANGDLVGHSGDVKAAIQCCKVLDECLSKIIPVALEHHYSIFLIADHGNVEQMLYPDGSVCPAHSTNRVPALFISEKNEAQTKKITLKKGKGLQDIAPTVLQLLGIKKPKEMTGENLIAGDSILYPLYYFHESHHPCRRNRDAPLAAQPPRKTQTISKTRLK
ncbi:MAG: 2,3-bisphosphoglycerate-independent phosphoglycerate mutase [Candidatus Gracilibacteria bacterium]